MAESRVAVARWSDEEETGGYLRDFSFLVVACLIHWAILSRHMGFTWSQAAPVVNDAVPVEFVQQIPASPLLAPMSPTAGPMDRLAGRGPGQAIPEKIKKGLPHVAHHRKIHRISAEERARRMALIAQRREEALARRQERLARLQAAAEEARLRREERLARLKAAAEERKRVAEEHRQAVVRHQAEVEQELATLSNPEEKLSTARDSGVAPETLKKGAADPAQGGPGPGADADDPVYDGKGGKDSINDKASGGGVGEGGGVAWAITGPAGGRRLLKRILPACPDWIAARGLDLSVQLKFRVLDDGVIQSGVLIQRTSGFPALDQAAIEALRRWKFEAYRAQAAQVVPEIWGIVKFHFVVG